MALPSTGTISMSQVNVELGKAATALIGLNDANVRSLAGRPSGTISMADLRGKAAYTPVSITTGGGFGQAFGGSCVRVGAGLTVSISGGRAPYTVVWTRLAGFATPTSRSVSISSTSDLFLIGQFLCPGGEASGTYRVTVTDSGPPTGGAATSATRNQTYNLIHFG